MKEKRFKLFGSHKWIKISVGLLCFLVVTGIVFAINGSAKPYAPGSPVLINLPLNFRGTLVFIEDKSAPPARISEHQVTIEVPENGIVKMRSLDWSEQWREWIYMLGEKRIFDGPAEPTPNEIAVFGSKSLISPGEPERMCSYIGTTNSFEENYVQFDESCMKAD